MINELNLPVNLLRKYFKKKNKILFVKLALKLNFPSAIYFATLDNCCSYAEYYKRISFRVHWKRRIYS